MIARDWVGHELPDGLGVLGWLFGLGLSRESRASRVDRVVKGRHKNLDV